MHAHHLFGACCAVLTSGPLPAQSTPSPTRLETLRDAKLAEPWLAKVTWVRSLPEAKARAVAEGRRIFLYCARSYAPCTAAAALEQGPLSTPAFASFSRGVVPYFHLSSGIAGDSEADLPRRLGSKGFPFVAFLDEDGGAVARPCELTIAGFTKTARALDTLATHEGPHRESGNLAAVFVARLELGRVELEVAEQRFESLRLTPDQRQRAEAELVDLRVADQFARARRNRDYSKLGITFAAMKRAGHVPTGRWRRNFWSHILTHARTRRDATLYEEACTEYKRVLGDSPEYLRVFARYDGVLAELKREATPPAPPREGPIRRR